MLLGDIEGFDDGEFDGCKDDGTLVGLLLGEMTGCGVVVCISGDGTSISIGTGVE